MQSVPDIPSDMYRTARLVYRAYEEPDMDHIVSWMQDPQFASSLSRRAPKCVQVHTVVVSSHLTAGNTNTTGRPQSKHDMSGPWNAWLSAALLRRV